MARTSRAVLEQRAFELMAVIERETNSDTRTAHIAYRDFSQKLGISETCVRLTLNTLQENKWIVKGERFLPNGGQIENAYILSPLGRKKLMAYLIEAQDQYCKTS